MQQSGCSSGGGAWVLRLPDPRPDQTSRQRGAEDRGSGCAPFAHPPVRCASSMEASQCQSRCLQCHSWTGRPMGGDWLAAGTTGPASSEGPGGCSGGLVKGEQSAALAEQALPWGQQEVAGHPLLTYLLGTKGKRDPVRGACVHLGMVVKCLVGSLAESGLGRVASRISTECRPTQCVAVRAGLDAGTHSSPARHRRNVE